MLAERSIASRGLPSWETLEFSFTQTDNMIIAQTSSAGAWLEEQICPFDNIRMSPAATALNYGQTVFEGMRAVRSVDGKIVLFRPEENAKRFRRSASRLEMPPYPTDQFIRSVISLVRTEADWVPPFGKGSLYIRPVMIGSGAMLGVAAAPSYTFYIFVSPVGLYRPGEGKLMVQDSTHRAAPYGTGDLKAAGNYAGTIRPQRVAAQRGYKDVLYLDAKHDRYVEEVGSSNFFAILKDGTLVTPRLLGSILPGITRDSLMTVAREIMGWKVIEKGVTIDEVLSDASEAFFSGTAAGIQPITVINYKGTDYQIGTGIMGSLTKRLQECFVRIQTQMDPDPFDWVHEV